MTGYATISISTLEALCPACKMTIASKLGLSSPVVDPLTNPDATDLEFAELGLQAARAFLQGCSSRTKQVLQIMIDAGDIFSLRYLERQMGADEGSLRGVWTGLTKRTRTITGDPEASLIDWGYEKDDGDYLGKFAPTTREAFRRALSE